MELELGLALSNSSSSRIIPVLKELDLISYVNCDDNSNLSSQSSVNNGDYEEEENADGFFYMNGKKKRAFDEAFDFEVESSVSALKTKTLPLLNWNKEPNEQEKNPKRLCKFNSFIINKNEGDGLVGWPPIKSSRKKLCHQNEPQHHHTRCRGRNFPAAENGGVSRSNSMLVKVQMEGFFITRKIDLMAFQCYESLICSLLSMFGKEQEAVNGYKLTYQDREGDWLLAGDVPWRTFIRSVKRLKLMKRDV